MRSTGLVAVALVALMAWPARDVLASAAGRKPSWEQRFRQIDLPMPGGVVVKNEWPWAADGQAISAGAVPAENAIYWRGQRPDKVTLGHEVGHLFDHAALNDANRAKLARLLGYKRTRPWQQGYGLRGGGLTSPNERFADWYGNLAAGKGNGSWDGAYSSPPELRQLVRFGEMLERIGRKRGLGEYKAPTF
jgi:hypothetical protein